jgi:predicted Abi (CAAX) family protease
MLNPKLKEGDRVILLHMEGEMMSPGSKGTVTKVNRDPFEDDAYIYNINWDEGGSLSLLSITDAWRIDKEK